MDAPTRSIAPQRAQLSKQRRRPGLGRQYRTEFPAPTGSVRRLSVLLVLASALIAVTTAASLATAGQSVTSATAVKLQADALAGLRPNGTTVVYELKATADGDDASSLAGAVEQFGSGGANSFWPATGSVEGNIVTLAGVVAGNNTTTTNIYTLPLHDDIPTAAMNAPW